MQTPAPSRHLPIREDWPYVVRHGQTEHNVDAKWTGRDDSHLTDRGREDGRKSGQLLRECVEHRGPVY